jgi:alpha-tubulin suppressor-like RCC1 family protein/fibronectin type 3 domain-containing protein
MPLKTAKQFIKEMNNGEHKNFGHKDWRIPAIDELETLIDRSQIYPSIYGGHPFENVQNYYYWSSSGGVNIVGYAWVADMASGDIKRENISYCSLQYVWPVRGKYKNKIDYDPLKQAKLEPAVTDRKLEEDILLATTRKQINERVLLQTRLDKARAQLEDEKTRLEGIKEELENKFRKKAPPKAPFKTKASAASPNQIDLSWDAPDDVKVAGYNVYKDGTFLKSVTGTSVSQTDLNADSIYCYNITAYDKYGNESKQTQGICGKTLKRPDTTPPSVPGNLIAKSDSPYQADLSWGVSTDNTSINGYKIYQDGSFLKAVEGVSASITGLIPDTRHCYVVTAYDGANNESEHSLESCAKTLYEDKKRPSVPVGITMSEQKDSLDLSWGDSVDDVGVSGYNIYKDGVFMKAVASNSAFNLKVKEGEAHCYSITAADAVGNESRRSRQVCVSKKDKDKKSTDTESGWGTVWAGGFNKFGQLGHGSTSHKFTLVMVKELKEVINLAASVEHTLALKSDGTLLSWGRNNRGQLGDGTMVDRHSPVKVKGLTDVVDVSAGKTHSIALKSDGTVWTWGRNYYGQLGDGTLVDRSLPVQVKGLDEVVAVAAGWYHGVALKSDGTVRAWGWNRKGQLGYGTTKSTRKPVEVEGLDDIDMVAAGMDHTIALKSDGTVWAWGWNRHGQLGDGTQMDMMFPVPVKGVSDIEVVSAGMEHTVALKNDGTVWAWGRNDYGQIGVSTSTQFSNPTMVEAIEDVKEIDAGAHHTVALKSDGTVWAWGWRLVRNTKKDMMPVKISGLTGIIDIQAGKRYTVAIKGTL